MRSCRTVNTLGCPSGEGNDEAADRKKCPFNVPQIALPNEQLRSLITQASTSSPSTCLTPQAKPYAVLVLKRCRQMQSPVLMQEGEYHLPPQRADSKKKTLVLDLDETLVHSAFQPVENVDIVLPVKGGTEE